MNDNLTFSALRQANAARQAEWCLDRVPDLSFRGNEMAGEVGEACNVIKKLERERHGWRGSRATVADLAKELADVVITADLAAMQVGISLGAAVAAKFDEASEKNGLATRISTRILFASMEVIQASDVSAAMEDGAGFWRSCTGCHELNDGVPTGRFSRILRCHLGLGCRECGGIGAVWDTTDYAAMGDAMAKSGDEDLTEICIACAVPFTRGDHVYRNADGGALHAECCGPDRDSYVGADGQPLKDGEPIPAPMVWMPWPEPWGLATSMLPVTSGSARLDDLIDAAKARGPMTAEEIATQRANWAAAEMHLDRKPDRED